MTSRRHPIEAEGISAMKCGRHHRSETRNPCVTVAPGHHYLVAHIDNAGRPYPQASDRLMKQSAVER
jgi:hypothetical protein